MDIEVVNEHSAVERKRLEVIQELLGAQDRASYRKLLLKSAALGRSLKIKSQPLLVN